jgi:hypothetical protein
MNTDFRKNIMKKIKKLGKNIRVLNFFLSFFHLGIEICFGICYSNKDLNYSSGALSLLRRDKKADKYGKFSNKSNQKYRPYGAQRRR